jgi:mono/diheme cytochrome c family protein
MGNTSCRNCHGGEGQGAWGPGLAGRNLSLAKFRRAVRRPTQRMPAYVPSQLSDQEVIDVLAHLNSLPLAEEPGPWRVALPANAPRGQELAVKEIGCAQCHGATFETPRHGAAEAGGDFAWFKRMVYTHAVAQPEQWKQLDKTLPVSTPAEGRVRMGNYSRARLSESTLKEIWNWMTDLGHIVPLTGRVSPGETTADGVTYTVSIANSGIKDKGLVAEGVTVVLNVPTNTKVVSTTGDGYQGVRHDDEAKSDVAVWTIPRLASTERQMMTITFAGANATETPRGKIRWAKPSVKVDDDADITPVRGGRGAR